ncbi:MAG: hypothetical protein ABJD11_01035 [Gemmatimonadota bacterium]
MSRASAAHERPKPYPESWEKSADLRVLRTTAADWERLITWRGDMRKRGWKLLRVNSDESEIVAVFGKTKVELPSVGS